MIRTKLFCAAACLAIFATTPSAFAQTNCGDSFENDCVAFSCDNAMSCDACGCDSATCSCASGRRLDRLWKSIRGKGVCCPLFVRAGVGTVLFGESANIRLAGNTVPGAGIAVDDNTTFVFDFGYRIAERWSIVLSSGAPPETTFYGTGPLTGVVMGHVTYAPIILSTQYHVPLGRRLTILEDSSLYVGAGLNYTFFYETVDDTVRDLDVDDSVGSVVQLGFQKNFKNSLGAFAEVKRIFLETEATGTFGLAPVDADLTLNATVLNFGMTYGY